MQNGQPSEMLGLLVVVVAALAAVVYAFMRLAGIIGGHEARKHGRPPPSTPRG